MHIAVILPETYRGGTLRGALNIVRMLAIGAQKEQDALKLTFGHVDCEDIYSDNDFIELKNMGIEVRPFKREKLSAIHMDEYYKAISTTSELDKKEEYIIFNDGVANFEDADFWLIISDRVGGAIPPHRKYAVVVYDYIQRYVPEIFGKNIKDKPNWLQYEVYAKFTREANFVICTSNQTRRDCINYAGASSTDVYHFPMEFDPVQSNVRLTIKRQNTQDEPYIIWTTNSTQHKNHLNVIRGLEEYFSKNGTSQLQVVMTGVYTHLFDVAGKDDPHYNDEYPQRVRQELLGSPNLKNRIKIKGNLADSEYVELLMNASWLLHGAIYDNGTFSLLEAAWLGVPSISSIYPAISEQCQNFNLDVVGFDPHVPTSLALALKKCLPERELWVAKLPSQEVLKKQTYHNIAIEYWSKLKHAIENIKP